MAAERGKIDHLHRQNYQTCLLSSFAVVGNYFINEQIELFFHDYYREYIADFNLHNVAYLWPQFGLCQSGHINYLGQCTSRSGYRILFDLYTNSQQRIFNLCRESFNAELIRLDITTGNITNGTFNNTHINAFLRDTTKNSIINVFINNHDRRLYGHIWDRIAMHSLTVYFDNGFYFHDTGNPQNDIPLQENWWNFARIGDILLYWEK